MTGHCHLRTGVEHDKGATGQLAFMVTRNTYAEIESKAPFEEAAGSADQLGFRANRRWH